MAIRWSSEAADDLQRHRYIRRDNPIAARRVATEIYERAVASLNAFPYSGRPGRVQGTRELPLPPLPFVVVYRVRDDAVEIANILHGAQKWP